MTKLFSMKLLFRILPFVLISFASNAQFPGCPDIIAGPDQCVFTPCIDIVADPFEVGETTSYTAQSIPYNPPINFGAAGGTPVSVGTDDVWSSVITLPFTFCYFGQMYTQCVIGSNGAISFNLGNAGGFQPWSFSASCPSASLVSAGDIFGPYHDIDPSVGGNGVNYYLLGTAPCRIFVVTWENIPMFSCNNLSSSHMIVLYETTNAIDVYVQDREVCTSWNSGNAVIGVQNPTGTAGIAAPGRNTGPWGVSTPEGWRFNPDGAPIYVVEWYEGGNLIGTGDTVNVCPTVQTTYTAQVTYTTCSGTTIVETDDIVLTPSIPLLLDVSQLTNVSCNGGSDGEITVAASGGISPYSYTINGGPSQSQTTFAGLPAGAYSIEVTDNAGCTQVLDTVITEPAGMTLTEVGTTSATCGQPNGQLEISVTGGLNPYSYSTDSGVTSQGTGLFTGIYSGTYSVVVTDNNGCMDSINVIVGDTPAPTIDLVLTDTVCSGMSDGVVEVSATGGAMPYQYNVNGGTSQSSGIFNNQGEGVSDYIVVDATGCSDTISVEVYVYPDPTIFNDTTACNFGIFVNNTSSYAGGIWSCADTAVHFNPNNTVDNPEIYTIGQSGVYTVTYTDNTCGTQISSDIDFVEYPSTWLNDTLLCNGIVYNLVAPNSNAHTTNYQWNNGTPGETIQITEPGVYILTMTNVCHTGVDSITIEYQLCDINVPNVLSIAEGSQNSLWYVQTDGLGEFHVFITNRWGNVVYECDDADAKCYWDGRAQNGTFVNAGTYFYTIEAKDMNGSPLIKHGFITVVE